MTNEARLRQMEDLHRDCASCVVKEAVAEVRRLQERLRECEEDYEWIRDAVQVHLSLFVHDADQPEPMIMAEAIKDAGEALGDLRRDEDSGEWVSDERERLKAQVDRLQAIVEAGIDQVAEYERVHGEVSPWWEAWREGAALALEGQESVFRRKQAEIERLRAARREEER